MIVEARRRGIMLVLMNNEGNEFNWNQRNTRRTAKTTWDAPFNRCYLTPLYSLLLYSRLPQTSSIALTQAASRRLPCSAPDRVTSRHPSYWLIKSNLTKINRKDKGPDWSEESGGKPCLSWSWLMDYLGGWAALCKWLTRPGSRDPNSLRIW